MRESESILIPKSIIEAAGTCTLRTFDLRALLGKVATVYGRGAAKWLERQTGCSTRTARYWLAGTYEPRGEDALKIVRAFRVELDAIRKRVEQFELSF